MQSAFWQTRNNSHSLDWCDRAISYKPNNANAWYKRGTILTDQAKEILPQSKIEEIIIYDIREILKDKKNKETTFNGIEQQLKNGIEIILEEEKNKEITFNAIEQKLKDKIETILKDKKNGEITFNAIEQKLKDKIETILKDKKNKKTTFNAIKQKLKDEIAIILEEEKNKEIVEKLKDKIQNIPVSKERKRLAINKLQDALVSYDQALKIQPYDHRFWQARGDVLMELGNHFLSIERQISELVEDNSSDLDNKDDPNKSGTILQQAAYYRRANNSYDKALRFQPHDSNIGFSKNLSSQNCKDKLEKIRRILEIEIKQENNNSTESSFSDLTKNGYHDGEHIDELIKKIKNSDYEKSFTHLIKNGDFIRLHPDLDNDYLDNTKKEQVLKKALDFYNRAIYLKPEYPLGWYSRGLAQSELGVINKSEKEIDKAIKDFNKALECKDDLSWAFYDRGIAHYRIADRRKDILGKDSKNQEVQKEYESALNDFAQAIKINSEYGNAWYYRGLVLAQLKKCQEDNHLEQTIHSCREQAIASYDRAIQICREKNQLKEETRNWYDKGNCYRDSELKEEAIASYKRAISRGEEYQKDSCKQIMIFAVSLILQKGLYQIASLLLQDYPKQEEPYVNSCYELGKILCSKKGKKDHQEAIEKLQKVIDSNPIHEEAHYYCGLALYKQENFDDATKQLKKVIDLNSEHKDAHYYYALSFYKQGKFDNAKKQLEKVINLYKKDKKDLDLILDKQKAEDLKDCQQAINFINELIKNNQTSLDDSNYNSGLDLYKRGKYDEAIEKFKKIKHIEEYEDARCYWGLALYKQGKYDEAIEKFKKIEHIKEHEAARYHLGLALYKQGKRDEVIEQFEEIIKWYFWVLALPELLGCNNVIEKLTEVIKICNQYVINLYHRVEYHSKLVVIKKALREDKE